MSARGQDKTDINNKEGKSASGKHGSVTAASVPSAGETAISVENKSSKCANYFLLDRWLLV